MSILSCRSASTNLTLSCIPGADGNGFDLTRVANNTQNGVCSSLLYQVFSTCPSDSFSYMSGLDPTCYSSEQALRTCLPGASSAYTKKPSTCNFLSHLVFFANEASTFLPSAKKLVAIAATYLLRQLEVKTCLAECPIESFTFLGPNEYSMETSRYAKSLTQRNLQLVDTIIDAGLLYYSPYIYGIGFATKLCYKYLMGPHLYIDQLIDAPLQQEARNRDFKEMYTLCEKYATKEGPQAESTSTETKSQERIKEIVPDSIEDSNSQEVTSKEPAFLAQVYAQSLEVVSSMGEVLKSAQSTFNGILPTNMTDLRASLNNLTNQTIQAISEAAGSLSSPPLLITDDTYDGEGIPRSTAVSNSDRDMKILLNRMTEAAEQPVNQNQLEAVLKEAERNIDEALGVYAEVSSISVCP